MRQHLALLIPTLLVGGCSLIYNPNNITKPNPDANDAGMVDTILPIDAPFDAPPLADANPMALSVESVFPPVIYEGQGVDNSPPAVLVIKGHHFIQGATVSVAPMTDLTLGTPVVSANGDYIAVTVTAAVNNANDSAAPVTVQVLVDESGAPTGTSSFQLQYLPQLTGNTITLPLAERYSRVALGTGPFTFAGTAGPVIMHSMSSIKCGSGAMFNAKGKTNATQGAAGAGGPGGCDGGGADSQGGCPGLVGGGGFAAGGNGGGGGGYGTAGSPGGGGAGGGAAHGSALVLTYAGSMADGSDRNQSGGGGGGTLDTLLGGAQGGGGGGGGTVEMTAGGDISCGTVDVSGGVGQDGTGGLMSKVGGGGGGSGGLLVVRTDHGTIMATLTAGGGAGGLKAGNGTPGGAGGVGRIRVDVPGTLPTTSPNGVVHRGLAFAAATMNTYTVPNPMITITGSSGDVFDMYVVDTAGMQHTGEPLNQTIDTGGMAVVQVSLLAGYNRLCATIRPGMRNLTDRFSLADKCIEVAYLP